MIVESGLTFLDLVDWNFLILDTSCSYLGKDKPAYIKGFNYDFKS